MRRQSTSKKKEVDLDLFTYADYQQLEELAIRFGQETPGPWFDEEFELLLERALDYCRANGFNAYSTKVVKDYFWSRSHTINILHVLQSKLKSEGNHG